MRGKNPSLDRVISAVGGQSALARELGTTQSTVWRWLLNGRVTPAFAAAVQAAGQRAVPSVRVTQAALVGLDQDDAA